MLGDCFPQPIEYYACLKIKIVARLEPGYLDAVVSARSHYRVEILEKRASFQVEGTRAIGSTVGDPRLHAWAADAHPRDSHTEHPAGVHLSEFVEEVRYVLLQGCLHLGGRALACEGHLNGCACDHNDDVEGWHLLAHILILQAGCVLHCDGVGRCACRPTKKKELRWKTTDATPAVLCISKPFVQSSFTRGLMTRKHYTRMYISSRMTSHTPNHTPRTRSSQPSHSLYEVPQQLAAVG
eukprot:scaffold9935_cov122-Isochrysis_galbana.AAC.4